MSTTKLDRTTQALVEAVDRADSADAVLEAVEDLAAAGSIDATSKLIEVLGYNNPGAAVAAVDGLIQIGEPAVLPLLQQLDGYNYGARAWTVRALAGIGDPRGLDILLAATSDFSLSVRRAASRGLGTIRWQEMKSDRVAVAQTRALQALLETCQDPEWIVRYASVVGMQGLAAVTAAESSDTLSTVLAQLEVISGSDLEAAVRARAVMAIDRLSAPSRT
ncbi:HEAT repeat domain-containing protein [Oscillatoriales cyanobacterium LEGE 11467]|uniref:HEAT repeat domain-containing protein n=1 Tax=Zarconia navalis LEGE 11467 TaxID=1828826 RepID=A0A928VU52_9CYAN|nr:HEAT repeat domain-containing protein [Zarconia navalis]MBE9040302.1 HEAT repeat domain-containing protein [Zarconia navalis LEGE 11467]